MTKDTADLQNPPFEKLIRQPCRLIGEGDEVKLIAHRGLNEMAPEATIPAFTLAGEKGMWGLKIDLCETKDGALVCSHDLLTDRLFDGSGSVVSKTLKELQQLTVIRGANIERYPGLKIVRFEEALEICRQYHMHPFLNFKYLLDRSTVFRAVDILREYRLLDQTVCQCSQDIVEYVYALREAADEVPIIFWLWEMNLVYGLPVLKTLGNACLGLNAFPGMEERQFEKHVGIIRDMGMPVCAALTNRSQLGYVRKWVREYGLNLLVTSGITYEDL
ncbi:MAG: hypothetical protein K6C08_07940 [Oscillospiraceae bacterium]|nr:hypothetical protein [Oscillospiraceae bacterium]